MKEPTTEAGRELLDLIMPAPVPDEEGRLSIVDAVRLDRRANIADRIRRIEGEARRRRVFARYRLEGCEMVPTFEGQWVHAEEIGIRTWVLDAPLPSKDDA